jgi:polyferredoxin
MTNFVVREKSDIFKNKFLGFLFKNKTFLFSLRVFISFLFFYAIYYGFVNQGKTNLFTMSLFWGVFWSLFMVTTLPTFGRIFCGICPHGFLGKYITKLGLKKSMPKWLQNRYIGLSILVIGWWGVYYTFDGFWKSPLNTALMFAVLTLLSFIIYYIYKDMSYCKYICPIGTLTRAYDKLSFTKLETYTQHCKDCKTFECATSCPYDLKPFTFAKKNQTDDCTLCMECANSCEAVKFKFTKPAEQLNKKLKILNIEVWSYILILACIPVSMSFAHGLNRSQIADEFIWNKTAAFLGMSEYAGGFAFIYALLFTSIIAVLGLFIASKILEKDFNSIFTTLGIAFIPLFIFSSLGHTLETFFVKDFEKIIEGFAQGFGFDIDIHSLAKRGDSWLHYFNLFKWLGIVWAFILLYKRMKLVDSTTFRKVLAYIFASSLILFFIGTIFYRAYILDTYGKKQNHSRHNMSMDKRAFNTTKQNRPQGSFQQSVFDPIYFSLDDPAKQNSSKRNFMMGGGNRNQEIPSKKIWLVTGDIDSKIVYKNKNIDMFYFNTNQNEKEFTKIKSSIKFLTPKNGYYNLYAIENIKQENKNIYKVAKLEYLHGKHGNEDIYNENIKKDIKQNKSKIDLIRIKSEDESSFFYKLTMGDNLKFKALLDNKPLTNAKIKIQLQSGWSKTLKTDSKGVVDFDLISDYFPKINQYDRRFKQEFLITLNYEDENTKYILTYPSYYYPNKSYYQSYGYALVIIFLTLLASGIIIYKYRKNRTIPFKEVKYA